MRKTAVFIIALLLCFTAVGCEQSQQNKVTASHDVRVMFINVGRADAALLCIDDKSYMIDTGEDDTALRLFAAMNYMGIESLDGLILTHTHSDHIGGAKLLLQYMPTETLYSAQISENKSNGENKIDNIAKNYSAEQVKLSAGDKIKINDDMAFEVLAPITYNADDDNDNSLVLRLKVNGRTILFTGDMQFAEELTLMSKASSLKADILKVGNHGNKDATSEQFALAVAPEYSIISTDTSVDENSANRRVKEALSMSEIFVTEDYQLGILLTIDENGDVSIEDPIPLAADVQLEIIAADTEKQTVTVKNNGETVSLDGYMLFSENGKELFVFEKGASVQSGDLITVACTGYEGDYTWPNEDKAWNKKKGDIAILYDNFGNEISRMTVAVQ
ncbi:MAG: MBL fold metallo-hydrolase [Clostridia bacterium]|nr:MBL fold metallo-hydrolase [Clostridia bacterium]